jgi:hypothetical protein
LIFHFSTSSTGLGRRASNQSQMTSGGKSGWLH